MAKRRKARKVERTRRARPTYRIVEHPSWQVQLLHPTDGWVTVAFCGSEPAAEKALQKRRSAKSQTIYDILR